MSMDAREATLAGLRQLGLGASTPTGFLAAFDALVAAYLAGVSWEDAVAPSSLASVRLAWQNAVSNREQ